VTDAGLPIEHWLDAAVSRFPVNSGVALWVASMFGTGLRFTAMWEAFCPAFLAQYTPVNTVPTAQEAFERLSMSTLKVRVLEFNRKFNVRAVHFDNVLRDAGRPGLNPADFVTSYSIKLCGAVKLYLDAVLWLRASNNAERILDNRHPIESTIYEAFVKTESFVL
jgi:hypothetical protein